MQELTLREVQEKFGGKLPPDAVFRSDDGGKPASPSHVAVAGTRLRSRRGERFAMLNAFVDNSMVDLSGNEAKVWLILFRDTKAATGTAKTGQADIARRAGIDARTVRRILGSLVGKGLVVVVRKGRLNAGPTVYRLHPTVSSADTGVRLHADNRRPKQRAPVSAIPEWDQCAAGA